MSRAPQPPAPVVNPGLGAAPDHIVCAAHTLDEGVEWCEATLGVTPGAGGRHALMGTHNRVFTLATPAFVRAYFELIAIDRDAPPPGRARWFGLDDDALRAALESGPQVVAWVARVNDLDAALAALAAQGIAAGRALQASRMTPRGALRWRIAVRDDGARLFGGALPTLIEWQGRHPAEAMPAVGAALVSLTLRAPPASALQRALSALGLEAVTRSADPAAPAFSVELDTPRGRVRIEPPH